MQYVRRINPRARSLKLQISPEGQVLVTTPKFVPEFLVKRFVSSHQGWITENLAKIELKKKEFALQKDTLLYFGETYALMTNLNAKEKIGVKVDQNNKQIIVNPVSTTQASIRKSVLRFLEKTLHNYVLDKVERLSKKMNIAVNKITFKRQSTRWGSCSSLGNLNFNWQLVHAPQPVIDYVIVHELAHRQHMDHSPAFWRFVEQFDPEYRLHRGWLKRHGVLLQNHHSSF